MNKTYERNLKKSTVENLVLEAMSANTLTRDIANGRRYKTSTSKHQTETMDRNDAKIAAVIAELERRIANG